MKIDNATVNISNKDMKYPGYITTIVLITLAAKRIIGYEIPLQPLATVPGISVHRVPLRYHDLKSPYALAVSSTSSIGVVSKNNQHATMPYNFLATQVWPSARTAAIVIENYLSLQNVTNQVVICEFGCGPGLPSLTAAVCHENCHVVATDIDPLALELVRQAAIEQNVSSRVDTKMFDLVFNVTTSNVPDADIYIFSDVFESAMVATGAALLTDRLLKENNSSKIWVFAQSDRAQREHYLNELKHRLLAPSLMWSQSIHPPNNLCKKDRLWLCNIDEANVFYG
jgi:predicted nicotinamide N-methyase